MHQLVKPIHRLPQYDAPQGGPVPAQFVAGADDATGFAGSDNCRVTAVDSHDGQATVTRPEAGTSFSKGFLQSRHS